MNEKGQKRSKKAKDYKKSIQRLRDTSHVGKGVLADNFRLKTVYIATTCDPKNRGLVVFSRTNRNTSWKTFEIYD